jgi:hypothetical protein
MTLPAKLPENIVINGTVHVCCYRDDKFICFQNYSSPRPTSTQPLQDTTPQIIGTNMFWLYRVVQHAPGETLGDLVGSFDSAYAAIAAAAKTQ